MFLAVSAPRALHTNAPRGTYACDHVPEPNSFSGALADASDVQPLLGGISCREGDPRRIYRPAHRYVRSALASISTSAM